MRIRMAWLGGALLGSIGASVGMGQVCVKMEEVRLEAGERVVAPRSFHSPWREEHRVGELRVILKASGVRALDAGGETVWVTDPQRGRHLQWLTEDEKTVYMVKKGDRSLVHRIALATGEPMPSLPVDMEDPGPEHERRIVAGLAGKGRALVLTGTYGSGGPSGDDNLEFYRVFCFDSDEEVRLNWSREFESAGRRDYTGGYLWAPTRPDYSHPYIRGLSWLEGSVLVCAGAAQDLVLLDPWREGEELWRLERIWELKRGFIGPSVWSHYISRFGLDDPPRVPDDVPEAIREHVERSLREYEETLERARKDAEERYVGAIVAGPVVSYYDGGDPYSSGSRFFVAVSTGPGGQWTGYLADCRVLEFDASGEPVSLTRVPRMVEGWKVQPLPWGAVWGCQGGGLFRLSTGPESVMGFGISGPDLLGRLDWYRELRFPYPRAWITTDPARRPAAFTEDCAFLVNEGGWVEQQGVGVYRFPIQRVDLESGVSEHWVLRVPFDGHLPPPGSNYSGRAEGPIRKFGSYVLHLTWLEIQGDSLRITLATDDEWTESLDFPLSGFE